MKPDISSYSKDIKITQDIPYTAESFANWSKDFLKSHGNNETTQRQIRFARNLCELTTRNPNSGWLNTNLSKNYQDQTESLLDYINESFKKAEEDSGSIFYSERFGSDDESHGVQSQLIATEGPQDDGKLHLDYIFVGHFDVADGYFPPTINGKIIKARGASDMQAGNIVACEVMKAMAMRKKQGEKLPSIGILLTGDEEIGGKNGAGYVFGKYGNLFDLNTAIILDGGIRDELQEKNTIFGIPGISSGSKGVHDVQIAIPGEKGHGAYPWKQINPILIGARLIHAIESDHERQTLPTQDTTVTFSGVKAGPYDEQKRNVLTNSSPKDILIGMDWRYIKPDGAKEIDAYLQQVVERVFNAEIKELQDVAKIGGESDKLLLANKIAQLRDLRSRVSITHGERQVDPYLIDMGASVVRRHIRAHELIMHEAPVIGIENGACDAHYLPENTNVILTRVVGAIGDHSEKEQVNLDGIEMTYQMLMHVVTNFPKDVS